MPSCWGLWITSLGFVLLIVHPSVWMAVAALVAVAVGEIIQATTLLRLYFTACSFGPARNVHGICLSPTRHRIVHRGSVQRMAHAPLTERNCIVRQLVWWSVVAVGVVTTLLLWVYDLMGRAKKLTLDGKTWSEHSPCPLRLSVEAQARSPASRYAPEKGRMVANPPDRF